MITPRRTRLVRVADLHAFRDAIVDAVQRADRDAMVVVPSAAAAFQLREVLSRRLGRSDDLPAFATREELYAALHVRLVSAPRRLSPYEREAMARAAAREASRDTRPVFESQNREPRPLRPGLVAEMLRFYDQLRRQRQSVTRFEELLEETLQRDAEFDRGAERMLAQTRLLAATLRSYERRVAASDGCDEHTLREQLLAEPSATPLGTVIVTVADWIADPAGLWVADFDLLARLPGLEAIDLIATDQLLQSGFHQRIHEWLPGLDEEQAPASSLGRPRLVVPAGPPERLWFTFRDREEELLAVARRVTADGHDRRAAVIYKHPLPYLYVAREVFRAAGVPYHTSDTVPLAAEPFAAALDLVFEIVASSFTREAIVAFLGSPHFAGDGQTPLARAAVSALDRALSDARYLGDADRLGQLAAEWESTASRQAALPALRAAVAAVEALRPLATAAPVSEQIACVLGFLARHASPLVPTPPGAGPSRESRARAAVLETLERLAAASRAHDDAAMDVSELASLVRRWIEEQTFAPDPAPAAIGLALVDDQAARYGEFDEVTIVGLIEGEWPERPHRNIFYSSALLKSLGWPSEKDWRSGAEGRFLDLLTSPVAHVTLTTITLDDEALVEVSMLVDELPRARLSTVGRDFPPRDDSDAGDEPAHAPAPAGVSDDPSRAWTALRLARAATAGDAAFHGAAGAPPSRQWSVSALETYLDCPFKFFARHILRLEEEPDDEEVMDPRKQGQFMHEVFERFFDRWQTAGRQAVTPANLDEALAMFERVVEDHLGGLSETEAALERTRLLGSSAAAGLGDAVLRMEAERPVGVVGRLLEHRLEGDFTFESAEGPRVIALRGKADRVDLLEDGTFRLIDYKLGWPPSRNRALQLPIYSLCAEQRLDGRLGRHWTLGEAAYLAFKGPKRVVPLYGPGDRDRVLLEAQQRLVDAVDAIERGDFPPHPQDVYRCETCAYAAVCRKDYVGDV